MNCPCCGNVLVVGANACGWCGAVLQQAPWSPPWQPPAPPRRPRTPWVVAAALATLLVLGAALGTGLVLRSTHSGDRTAVRSSASPAAGDSAVPDGGDFSQVYAEVSGGVGQVLVNTCHGGYTGSAFLVSPTLVATAQHVVGGASDVAVDFDGVHIDAQIYGVDLTHDLALLQLAQPVDGHVFTFSNTDAQPGTHVAAIGYPLDEPKTLTEGTVSGLGRDISTQTGSYTGLTQTDTPINPGNSGGPLVDLSGQVIGVADAIRTDAQGIGFAVPSSTARNLLTATLQTQALATC